MVSVPMASVVLMLNLVILLPMGMVSVPMDMLLQLTESASSTHQDTPSSMLPVASVVLMLTLMLITPMVGMDIPMLTVPMDTEDMDTDMDVDTTGVNRAKLL